MNNLRIVRQQCYAWRVNLRFSYEAHRWITGYAVFDGDREIIGGFDRGANYYSGSATYARKKHAQAFLEGYRAVMQGDVTMTTGKTGTVWLDDSQNPYKALRGKADEAQAFSTGAYYAKNEQLYAARRLLKSVT